MKELLTLEQILPLLESATEKGAPFRFFQRGTSMLPMLRQGVDSVQLVSKEKRPPKIGEVILYRRKNGAFVLHRIIGEGKDGSFITCGDNQGIPEKGVGYDSIIAVLDLFYRGEEPISADDEKYLKYVRKQMKTRFIRYFKAKLSKIIR